MRKLLIAGILVAAIVLSGIAIGWVSYYRAGLKPQLVLSLPVAECKSLVFGRSGLARGYAVDEMCRANSIAEGPVFALRGKIAVEFVPYGFHQVHGTLNMANADEGTVYFYRYRECYRPLIEAP